MTKEIQKPQPRADVWSEFDRAFDEMRSRFLDAFGIQPFGTPLLAGGEVGGPVFRAARTDIEDTGTSYKIVAEIPGIP